MPHGLVTCCQLAGEGRRRAVGGMSKVFQGLEGSSHVLNAGNETGTLLGI